MAATQKIFSIFMSDRHSAIAAWSISALRRRLPGVTINSCLSLERNATTPRRRYLNPTELRTLLSNLGAHDWAGDVLRAILATGCRPGEVLNVSWDDVGDDGWWTVPPEKSKSNRAHRVFLSDMALAAFGPRGTGRVFRVKRDKLGGAVAALQTKVGGAPFRAHDLRASTATNLSSLGCRKDIVAAVLGHAQRDTTDIYLRVTSSLFSPPA